MSTERPAGPGGKVTPSPGHALTREQFDEVIRRAAELAASDDEPGEGGLTEAELFRIAGQVGLPERHVRRALAEVRGGVEEGSGLIERWFGPARVRASRVIDQTPSRLRRQIDEFLVGGQLLQPVRASDEMLTYRPAIDFASKMARGFSSMSKRSYTAAATSVEVYLDELGEGRTFVTIDVDPGLRTDHVAETFLGGGFAAVGIGTGVGLLAGLAVGLPVVIAVGAGVVVGGGAGVPITRSIASGHRTKIAEVAAELEGVLDRLESGDPLEPPPPSWRRWVKRHFHGVARDLMGGEE